MIDAENYIRQNAPTVAENYIKALLWYQKPLKEYLREIEQYERKYNFCNAQELSKTVLNILKQLTTVKEMHKFILKRKELLVRPHYATVKEYIREEWQTSLSLEEIVYMFNQLKQIDF